MTAEEVKTLPLDQKIRIMEAIWEDLRDRFERSDLSPGIKDLLDQRRARHDRQNRQEIMSLDQLKEEAARLPAQEQRELIAFLVARQTEKDKAFKSLLAAKIDDVSPAHWTELSDVRKRYGR
ncbi:MAG TPA: hypothetical protein P5555_21205 [Candidatus Paceibacterota bacterium]|nr:hypothetical protein [Verrucomicrobiota bacterium]HOX04726.1 hypothetical protein [Verrucomicrobiota bacterium]HRZ47700.1 hypothetical protein [Candidatus Paceibacterota bacterium]